MYTFNLETARGRTGAGLETVIPVVILGVCIWQWIITENYIYGFGIAVSGLWLLLVTGAAWLHTLELQRIERNKLERESLTITPEIMLERERNIGKKRNIELLSEIDRLKDNHLSFAKQLITDTDLFQIHGQRVTWHLGGVAIPVTFAAEWLEKWNEKRSKVAGTHSIDYGVDLPAINAWNHESNEVRAMYREYVRAINSALVNAGCAQAPGGNRPARWIIADERARLDALDTIGLLIAANISNLMYEE